VAVRAFRRSRGGGTARGGYDGSGAWKPSWWTWVEAAVADAMAGVVLWQATTAAPARLLVAAAAMFGPNGPDLDPAVLGHSLAWVSRGGGLGDAVVSRCGSVYN
jgi:hypothetical protein